MIGELHEAEMDLQGSEPINLSDYTQGGPASWDRKLTTLAKLGSNDEALTWDYVSVPMDNPWDSYMRLGGFDFFEDNKRAAVCTWQGDVWIVSGLDQPKGKLTWRRIAAGMFQPLGLKIVEETIYVCCRDQITRLHDTNDDGEIDFYENFNNDHQVTEHFHEFAMGLETDKEGNFYYAKSARHAKPGLVPHHGTLLKVSKDGLKTEIVATGFRAANGVCVNDELASFSPQRIWRVVHDINGVVGSQRIELRRVQPRIARLDQGPVSSQHPAHLLDLAGITKRHGDIVVVEHLQTVRRRIHF